MMTRRLFCCSLSCSLLSLSVPARAQRKADRPKPVPPSREADSYAIWSLLLPMLQQPAKYYVIPDVTFAPGWQSFSQDPVERVKHDGNGLSQIQRALLHSGKGIEIDVPDDGRLQFHEAALEYAANRYGRVRIRAKFALAKPVRRLSDQEREDNRGPFIGFSEVYFDKSQTLGMVWADSSSGCCCGEVGWYFFRKEGGTWHDARWNCSTQEVCA